MKYLLLCLLLVGCTSSKHKCVLVVTDEFAPAECEYVNCNGAGCHGFKCRFNLERTDTFDMFLNGNVVTSEFSCGITK